MSSFVKTLIICIALPSLVVAQNKYQYTADLAKINNDKIEIKLLTPAIKESNIVFSFPKVIPGSYSEKNFGKFIEDFTASAKDGKKLPVKKINENQYRVSGSDQLYTVSYKVNDTWDAPDEDFIFQPGGSNIEAGSNIILNNHAFFGYFEGYKMLPFEIEVTKPADMFASTHLTVERKSETKDILSAQNYVYLADNPVFYCKPDTTSFIAGNSSINISVFSATGKVKSTQIADYLKPMAGALTKFFGSLPISSYQFLFYFEDGDKALIGKEEKGGGYGALEHNYSSLYFLPEMGFEPQLKSMVNDVTSHEFLHILTPLNLHSEEIENFDFVNPVMSKHLWLYEGVTEYFSQLVQVQNGLLTEKEFFQNMRKKINDAEEFGVFSMTEMSKQVLTPAYKDKYSSVYSKGAVIAMMLDLFIRDKTNNEKNLKETIIALTKKYGAGKPFKDDDLFNDLIQASHPDVKQFIDNYIIGDQTPAYAALLSTIGYTFNETRKIDVFYIGGVAIKYDDANSVFVFTKVEKNALGIKNEDVFVSVDGKAVTDANIDEIWEQYFYLNTDKPSISIIVNRNGKEKELSGTVYNGYREMKNYIEPSNIITAAQNANLRKLITQ
ncbi:peptidase M61 [soil metagenome]